MSLNLGLEGKSYSLLVFWQQLAVVATTRPMSNDSTNNKSHRRDI